MGEEATPVRNTDLEHLARDIKDLPDGRDPDEGAFWTCIGFAAGIIPSCAATILHPALDWVTISSWCIFSVGVIGAIYLGIKMRVNPKKDERDKAISHILQNIKDFTGKSPTDNLLR